MSAADFWRRLFGVRDRIPQHPSAPQETPAWSDFGRPKSQARWDYVTMTGPYRIWRCDDDDGAIMRGFASHALVADAIIEFSRLHYPRVGQCCMLSDGDDQVLLAWADSHHGEFDLRFQWWGCKMAFDMLSIVDPVRAALWEQLALEGATDANQ